MNITLLASDQQQSVIQAIDQCSSGFIAYTPYGYHRKENTSVCRIGFNGELPEASTEDYLLGNGYRAFNPVLMRFNSPDKLSPFGKGGVNTYAYCLGDPINRSDESGRFSAPWIATASPNYIKSRHASIAKEAWHSWSSMDIELVKHNTRNSPFSKSKLQPVELFGIKTSSKPFSFSPPDTKRFRYIYSPETLQVSSALAIDLRTVDLVSVPAPIIKIIEESSINTLMKRFYESSLRGGRRFSELRAFVFTPRAGQLERHRKNLNQVRFDLKESFREVAVARLDFSPSNIKKESRNIRD